MTQEKNFIAKEGYIFLLITGIVAVVLFVWHVFAGVVGAVCFLFCVYFFRNPPRLKPYALDQLTAPADGRVIFIGRVIENHFFNKPMQKISIFMSPFNVHVNRAPMTGEVMGKRYCRGVFLAAFDERAGDQNERSAVLLKTDDGDDIVFVQIAGWFARRIVSYPERGDRLLQGQIFGLIRFGSRMDIYFPDTFEPAVVLKQKVSAGRTVIAAKGKQVS
ncbi:MAG: phosphatidylserine decarboxylase family protein [Deltaproteobacteria bacterium]|nr:phosphatidylserine decarboxylase family protein [Deltaproteobacteria bacterium]